MYQILEVSDKIKVSPEKFELNLEDAIKASLENRLEGTISRDAGVILAITSVDDVGDGIIIPGDGSLYYPVSFSMLTYLPQNHELVRGEVIDVTDFGVFVRFGPVDGMVHVSQLMDDFVSYDPKNMMFFGKKTNQKIKEGTKVVARIISISMMENQYKIGLTMRQAGLGSMEWLEESRKKPARKTKK